MAKRIYFFEEGSARMRNLLGGKGAGLAEMTRIGLPVPPGFTITTEVCRQYYEAGRKLPDGLWEEVVEAMKKLEGKTGKKFGSKDNPLLVSVRSGAPVSMPGMMDTILNLGLNDETVQGLAELTKNERFAWDAYRRFVQMFGNVVMKIPHEKFEKVIEEIKKEFGVETDPEVPAEGWKKAVAKFKEIYKQETGREFPEDPWEQLKLAIVAVFDSWNNERAIAYREIHGIPHDMGTAVNIVTMVFGNMGEDSGTGVAFTRDPATGEKKFYGEYLTNAQGEDVVAGIRTPKPIEALKEEMPHVYEQLVKVAETLEKHFKDMQDIEFTIERGKLYMLQTRTGKRTAQAAVKIAVDMVREGLITKEEAVMRVTPQQVITLLHPQIKPGVEKKVIAKGLNASPGAATGKVIFDSEVAAELGAKGEKIILVRPETSPDDIRGMAAAKGILTSRGGMTSHAAVVARGMGKPAVVGAESILVDLEKKEFRVKGTDLVVKEGDVITIDGSTGEVILGEVPVIVPEPSPEFKELLSWADEIRLLGVRANADTPEDARKARELGAEGIGLARTEHMFFGEDRLPHMQAMILAETKEERVKALEKLLPMQKEDFKGLFRAMEGLPVIIRLLDPPLHEFLPPYEELLKELTELEAQGKTDTEEYKEKKKLFERVKVLREFNPMLGFRGCRLGIVYPEICEMQVRAIFEAVAELTKEGVKVIPKVMIPLVGHYKELEIIKKDLERIAKEVLEEHGIDPAEVKYSFGTMIEVPRAAITADKIAEVAEFFSFGTNDLTQMCLGFSRDDVEGKFMPVYVEKGIYEVSPFNTIDREGVGELMKMAIEKGRKTRPELEIGICGEQGGDPDSIEFCHIIGLDYVSASPYRVPVARLVAAQAQIKYPRGKKTSKK